MPKVLNLEYENPKTLVKSTGRIEIKNQTAGSADLYFYGDICSSSWDVWQQEDMCPQDVADFLNSLVGVQNINIYINSGGGDSFAGLAIYNILKRNPAKKTVSVDGLAASAASVIAVVGAIDGNQLILPPGAQLMIHNAWTIAVGNSADFRRVADALDKTSQSYAEVYAEHAADGVTQDQIKAMMDAETWMTGTEAALIFKNVQVQGEQIAASLESGFMSRYKNVPQSLINKPKSAGKPTKIFDGVIPPNISTEVAPDDATWSKPTLSDFTDKQWEDLTDQEQRDIAGHYAWSEEMPPDIFDNLKFPHHDPESHKVVFAGLSTAAARIDVSDIPDADKTKVQAHIAEHYHAFGKKAPWEKDDEGDDNSAVELAKTRARAALALSR